MCITIVEFECGHGAINKKKCLALREKEVLAKRERKGFFKKLFRRSPNIMCTARPGRKMEYRLCDECFFAKTKKGYEDAELELTRTRVRRINERRNWIEQEKQKAAETQKKAEEKAIEERKKAENDSREEAEFWTRDHYRRRDEKGAYLCDACRYEGRNPDKFHREPNNGLCCARGLQEYGEIQAVEYSEIRKYGFRVWEDIQRKRSREGYNNTDYRQVVPAPELRGQDQTIRTLFAGQTVSTATQNRGWNKYQGRSDEIELDPIVLLGQMTSPSSLLDPWCENLGFDEERWSENIQTGHGLFPPRSTPPPDRPLPAPPISRYTEDFKSREQRAGSNWI